MQAIVWTGELEVRDDVELRGASADAREGVQSFLEKRPPAWQVATDDTDAH